MTKVLVIDYRTNEVSKNIFTDNRVRYISLCKKNSFIWRCIDRGFMAIGKGGILLQRSLSPECLQDYSLIIVNEMIYSAQLIAYIRKHVPKTKIVYWFWDTASMMYKGLRFYDSEKELRKLLKAINKYGVLATSFDIGDCQKYKFTYRPQVVPFFSVDELRAFEKDHSQKIKQDVFFAGRDKGRLATLIKLAEKFNELKISYNFWISPDRDKAYNMIEQKWFMKDAFVPYKKIVQQNLQSKAILDIVQEGQQGLTWRPIEALLYRRKLITNFQQIKEYEFYRPENIFIIGEDSMQDLRGFLNSGFKEINIDVLAQYTFSGWLNKQLKNN